MKVLDSLIAMPALVSLTASGDIWLRGRFGSDDVLVLEQGMPLSAVMGAALLAVLCISAAVLTARELHAEAADARALQRLRA